MKLYGRWIAFLCICFLILSACTDNNENTNENNNTDETDDNSAQEDVNERAEKNNDMDEDLEDMDETNDNQEENMNADASADEEQYIEGKVVVKEDENIFRVELETNLVEGTLVSASLWRAFGIADTLGEKDGGEAEVDSDGTVTLDVEVIDDFYELYQGLFAEMKIEVEPEEHQDLGPKPYEAYGPEGEKFKGPLVYQYEVFEPLQKLQTSIIMEIGGEETEYDIETPEREPLPDDYGETDIWMEAEVVDNDHRFLYVEGKTNLLEGLTLSGDYYTEDEASLPQVIRATSTKVEPDGTFFLPVAYESISEDGYIEIQSGPNSAGTLEQVFDEYGDDFGNLDGDVVKEKDDHKEIVLILETEGMDVDAPEDSMITEEDGELRIEVPDDVLFDFDKSNLKDDAKETLDDVIGILEGLDDGEDVEIKGHTDNEGEPDYNMTLSEDRAAAVEEYLKDHGDMSHLSIETKGYGEEKPITSNEEEEGRKKNRRVEIVFNEND